MTVYERTKGEISLAEVENRISRNFPGRNVIYGFITLGVAIWHYCKSDQLRAIVAGGVGWACCQGSLEDIIKLFCISWQLLSLSKMYYFQYDDLMFDNPARLPDSPLYTNLNKKNP